MRSTEGHDAMIGKAAFLFQWANTIEQEERNLRVWMRSTPETSRIMDHIDHVDVRPSSVVPLLKACQKRYLSGDSLPEGHLRSMIHSLHDWKILPALVLIVPSDWDCQGMNAGELAIIAGTLDYNYPNMRVELNGDNWEANSLALIKGIATLEAHARRRAQDTYVLGGGQGYTRPDVGDHFVSENMAGFIIDNPDHCEEIVDVMLTRRTRDFDLISSIIGSDAKALSSGAL
jgi:hypothetical protein